MGLWRVMHDRSLQVGGAHTYVFFFAGFATTVHASKSHSHCPGRLFFLFAGAYPGSIAPSLEGT